MQILNGLFKTACITVVALSKTRTLFRPLTTLSSWRNSAINANLDLKLIEDSFKQIKLEDSKKQKIVETFFRIAYYMVNDNPPVSDFERLVQNLPAHLSKKEKIDYLAKLIKTYPGKPVFTGHPTNVVSNQFIKEFNEVFEKILKISKMKIKIDELENLIKTQIVPPIQKLLEQNIVMQCKKTPDEEAEYTMYLKSAIITNFPEILDNLVLKVANIINVDDPQNHIEVTYIKTALQDALLPSFMIEDWTRADFDGNHAKTADSMKTTLAIQQKAIIKIFKVKIKKILTKATDQMQDLRSTLSSMDAFFDRCLNAIDHDILFDVPSSNTAVQRSLSILDKAKHQAPGHIQKDLQELAIHIKSFGYFGGMLEYVRQTTDLNYRVWSNLFATLAPIHPELKTILLDQDYADLNLQQQTELLSLIEKNPKYFSTIKTIYSQHPEKLTPETQTEIARLIFIMENTSIFPYYIFSDTKAALNLHEFRILAHLVRYLGQKDSYLKIGEIQEFPLTTLFLCETPKDLENFPVILRDALNNPGFRNKIIKDGLLKIVSGPSDVGKTGGLAAHIGLFRAQNTALSLLEEYKAIYPELAKVELQVLNGYGGDINRNIGSSATLSHSTCQGFDAFLYFGMHGMYQKFLENVIGYKPENIYKTQEIINLRTKYPKSYQRLLLLEQLGTQGYQAVFTKPINQALIEILSLPDVEPYLNKSSRAGSKKSLRAIGIVNMFMLSRVYWNMFSSIYAWQILKKKDSKHFHFLYENVSVIKNIVLKTLYSIAMSNFAYADKKIKALPNDQENKNELIKHWQKIVKNSYDALKVIIKFLSPEQNILANKIIRAAKNSKMPANEVALELIDKIEAFSGLRNTCQLELHQNLEEALIEYQNNTADKKALDRLAMCSRLLPTSYAPAELGNRFFSPLRYKKFNNPISSNIDFDDNFSSVPTLSGGNKS